LHEKPILSGPSGGHTISLSLGAAKLKAAVAPDVASHIAAARFLD
jgi:hypothetical protein